MVRRKLDALQLGNFMELTRQQRHTAYIIMLEEAERPSLSGFYRKYHGLCYLFLAIFDSEDFYFHPMETLPELYAKRPLPIGSSWFDLNRAGWQKRIELLKQCIEETY